MTRFVVDCETLLRIAGGEIEVAPEQTLVALTQLRADAFGTSDRELAPEASGLVETATIDTLRTA